MRRLTPVDQPDVTRPRAPGLGAPGPAAAGPGAVASLVFVAFAFVPLYPAVSLGLLALLLVVSGVRRRLLPGDLDAPAALAAAIVAAIGVLAQLANWAAPALPAALVDPPLPVAAGDGTNLLAAHDPSWLRGWSRAGGLGGYATPVDGAFWRIQALDPISGERVTEAVAALEVPLPPGHDHALSVVVRHDGSRLQATLFERTRDGRQRLPTVQERLGPNLLRLHAVLPPRDAPARVRSLHLVDLAGDWTYLDVGWPSLTAGAEPEAYAPRAGEQPWPAGIAWWLGLGVAWSLTPLAARAVARLGAGAWVAPGLIAGLFAQAALAVGQVAASWPDPRRAAGSLVEPNLLAHVAVVTALAAAATSRRPLPMGTLAVLLAAVVIAASGSRAGVAGLALGAGLLLATRVPHWRRRTVVIAVGCLVVGTVLAAAVIAQRSADPWLEDPNLRARLQMWQATWQVAAERPWLGVGHQRVALFYEFHTPPEAGPVLRNAHAHNAWLELAGGFGWPTALAFSALLLVIVRPSRGRRAPAATVVVAVALALNLVDLSLFHPAFFLPVWTACCLPAATNA